MLSIICIFLFFLFNENIIQLASSHRHTFRPTAATPAAHSSVLTFLAADGDDGAAELQALVPVGIDGPGRTLHPGARLEVDGVQRDHLGRGEEGVHVHLSHGAGDAVRPGGGADEPAVAGQSVVDVLADAD